MPRPAAVFGAAAVTLTLFGGASAASTEVAAAAQPEQTAVAQWASVRQDAGHDDHGSGDGEVAEWPPWAHADPDQSPPIDDHDRHTDGLDGHGPDTGSPDTGEHGNHGADGGHGERVSPAPERPRRLVLGSFAAVNGAVVLVAAIRRRRTRSEVQRRKTARAAAQGGHRISVHPGSRPSSRTQ